MKAWFPLVSLLVFLAGGLAHGAAPGRDATTQPLRLRWTVVSDSGQAPVEKELDGRAMGEARGLPPPTPSFEYALAAGGTYRAELPADVRTGALAFSLAFTGPVAGDPSKGPTISIDGALIGFSIPQPPSRGAPGAREGDPVLSAVQVVAGIRRGGATAWLSTITRVIPRAGESFIGWFPPLKIVLHPATRTWDVLSGPGNTPLVSGLPYVPETGPVPTITITTFSEGQPSTVRNPATSAAQ